MQNVPSPIAFAVALASMALLAPGAGHSAPGTEKKPNLIFIMADDLGYGELGSFGQQIIQTPRLDEMAAKGMKLTDFYAGSTVCAPSRSVLMTGQHSGRTWVRGNAGAEDRGPQTLREEDFTVAELFQEAGYATALIGKWGLGELGTSGHPNRQGFDYFFGYLNQRHAHNFYPTFLIRDDEVVPLANTLSSEWEALRAERGFPDDGAGWANPEGRIEYSHDLFAEDVLEWVSEQADADRPFFLYFPLTIPHANNEGARGTGDGQEVPDHGIYAEKDWPDPDKGQAAMVTLMDADVGRLLDLLEEKEIAGDTLVIFTSDNGHHREGGNDPERFNANGPLKGMKRDLYEGGIRVPTVAWWPGKIEAGSVSGHPAYFGDLMATAAELAGVEMPEGDFQSISFLPALTGRADEQEQHDYLYWEFYERGSLQAVRFGKWKAIRTPLFTGEVELYDLETDLGEENNIAADHPEVVAEAIAYMEEAHQPNANWQPRGQRQ